MAPRGGGGAGGRLPPYDFRVFFFFFLVSSAVSHVHDDNTLYPIMIFFGGGGSFEVLKKNVSDSPPPRSATFSALAQHFRAGAAVARHFALHISKHPGAAPDNTNHSFVFSVYIDRCPNLWITENLSVCRNSTLIAWSWSMFVCPIRYFCKLVFFLAE